MGRTPELDIRKLFAPNLIINGSMAHHQRAEDGAIFPSTISGTGFTLDRWAYTELGISAVSMARTLDAPNLMTNHCLNMTVTTAMPSPGATDYALLYQPIEGMMLKPYLYGTPFIITFWAKTNVSGNLPVMLINSGTDRSFVSHVAIIGDNTWRRYSVYVPTPPFSSGTWNFDNGTGFFLEFGLVDARPATLAPSLDTWLTGLYSHGAGATNFVATLGNNIKIAQVQMVAGNTIPENFNFHGGDPIKESMMCHRYFRAYKISSALNPTPSMLFVALDSNTLVGWLPTEIPMRANATTRTDNSTSWTFRDITTGVTLSQTINDGSQSTSINAGVGYDELAIATAMAIRLESTTGTFVTDRFYSTPMDNRLIFLDAEL